MPARVSLDLQRCEGYGFCEQAAPEIFRMDAEGDLVVEMPEIPDSLVARAEAAARVCPVAALRIEQWTDQ